MLMLAAAAAAAAAGVSCFEDNAFDNNIEPLGANQRPFKRQSQPMGDGSVQVHEREFKSAQVKIQMECQRDKTIIRLNFTRPFNGIVGAGKLDTTKCKLNGNGTKVYELHVRHNSTDCDTQWDSANSSIFNTLFIRFHSSLETGSDIAKNVMCRLTVGDLIVGRRPSSRSNTRAANSTVQNQSTSSAAISDQHPHIEFSVSPPISNLIRTNV